MASLACISLCRFDCRSRIAIFSSFCDRRFRQVFAATSANTVSLQWLLLSHCSRQREWLSALLLSICLSVCHQDAEKMLFSQKLSNLELWSLLTTYRKSYMGFSKNPLMGHYWTPQNPRWQRSAILDLDAKMQKGGCSQKLSNLSYDVYWQPIGIRTWSFQRTHYWTPKT